MATESESEMRSWKRILLFAASDGILLGMLSTGFVATVVLLWRWVA